MRKMFNYLCHVTEVMKYANIFIFLQNNAARKWLTRCGLVAKWLIFNVRQQTIIRTSAGLLKIEP